MKSSVELFTLNGTVAAVWPTAYPSMSVLGTPFRAQKPYALIGANLATAFNLAAGGPTQGVFLVVGQSADTLQLSQTIKIVASHIALPSAIAGITVSKDVWVDLSDDLKIPIPSGSNISLYASGVPAGADVIYAVAALHLIADE